MRGYIFLFFVTLFFFSGCAKDPNLVLFQNQNGINKQVKDILYIQNQASKEKNIVYQYKIKPGDIITVSVFNHPELTPSPSNTNAKNSSLNGLVVNADGTIVLPLIGKVKIAGLTEEKATEKLTKLYAQYVKNPYVLLKVLNKKVYVLGEVKKPGVIPLESDYTTLIDAISECGGFTDQAKRTEIKIISGNWNNPVVRIINLSDMNSFKLKKLILTPNEIVYVEPIKSKPLDIRINGIQPVIDFVNSILNGMVNVKTLRE